MNPTEVAKMHIGFCRRLVAETKREVSKTTNDAPSAKSDKDDLGFGEHFVSYCIHYIVCLSVSLVINFLSTI